MEIGVLHLMEEITWKHETRQSQQYGDTCTPLTFMLMEKYVSGPRWQKNNPVNPIWLLR